MKRAILLGLASAGLLCSGPAAATPGDAAVQLTLEVDGTAPPARGRYVIQPRSCSADSPRGSPRQVPVAGEAPTRTVRLATGCYDVRYESVDRRGRPLESCDLGVARVPVRSGQPTTVVFVGHCNVPLPLVN